MLNLAKEGSLSSVSRQMRLSWSCIDRIIQRGISRGLTGRWKVDCKHLSVDETAIGKGRDFITVLSNHVGQVLAITDGRSSDSLMSCLRSIPIQFLSKTKTISMDMSPAYILAAKKFFGKRYRKIISMDHFHIAKLLTKAVEDIRKDDIRKLPSLDRMKLHNTRYCWLRNGNNLTEKTKRELLYQQGLMVKTSIAWALKEKARDIWHGKEPQTRKSWFLWFELVKKSALKSLEKAATTIKKHLDGIMTSIRTGTSNAKAEALNKNIKNLGRLAHGFRNRERYKAAIYLRFGGLEMDLQH